MKTSISEEKITLYREKFWEKYRNEIIEKKITFNDLNEEMRELLGFSDSNDFDNWRGRIFIAEFKKNQEEKKKNKSSKGNKKEQEYNPISTTPKKNIKVVDERSDDSIPFEETKDIQVEQKKESTSTKSATEIDTSIAKKRKSNDSKVVNKYDSNRNYCWSKIVVRFPSEEDQRLLKKNFKKSKIKNLSTFIRNRSLDENIEVRYVDENLDQIKKMMKELVYQIGKVGVNYNQVVQRVNSLGVNNISPINENLCLLTEKTKSLNKDVLELIKSINKLLK